MIKEVYIIYSVVGAISTCCTVFVALTILRFGGLTTSTRLLLYLHLTLFLEDISIVPIYNGNKGLCQFIGFLKIYSGLANITVLVLIAFTYRYLFIEDTWKIGLLIKKRMNILVFGLPAITALPFATDNYGPVDSTWCALQKYEDDSNVWVVIFAAYVGICIVINLALLLSTLWFVYRSDPEMGKKLLKNLGMYALVATVAWILIIVARERILITHIYSNSIIYISGIIYFLVFLREKKALQVLSNLYKTTRSTNLTNEVESVVDDRPRLFSWEVDDDGSVNSHLRQSGSDTNLNRQISRSSEIFRDTINMLMNSTFRSSHTSTDSNRLSDVSALHTIDRTVSVGQQQTTRRSSHTISKDIVIEQGSASAHVKMVKNPLRGGRNEDDL